MDKNVDYAYIVLSNVFDEIDIAKSYDLNELERGETPYIGRSNSNNGLQAYVDSSSCRVTKGQCITIGMVGTYTPFWQENDFVSSQNILTLRSRFINRYSALYVITVLKVMLEQKYSYNRPIQKNKIQNDVIYLPYNHQLQQINWKYMEDYIKSLCIHSFTTHNRSLSPINTCKWRYFHVGDIFEIKNGKGIILSEVINNPGTLKVVQSGAENNGVIGYIDVEYCQQKKYTLELSHCLTVARTGTAGFVAIQNNGCVVGDSAKILKLKQMDKNTLSILIFLRTVLMQLMRKYTYGRKVSERKYLTESILLPAEEKELGHYIPDWQYMEDYIKSLPYGDCI